MDEVDAISLQFSPKLVQWKLPAIWNDDMRMNAMFSDVRNRNVNSVDFDVKMVFWTGMITDWLDATDRMTFSLHDARKAFTRKGCTPRCLENVITEIMKQGTLLPVSDFRRVTSSPGWLYWSVDLFIKKPLSYAWSFIKGAIITSQTDDSISYINMLKLKEKAEAISSKHHSLNSEATIENPLLLEKLRETCTATFHSESDLELCLLWLQKEGSVTLYNEGQQKVVKFLDGPQKAISELSKTEKAVIQLGLVKKRLKHQIEIHQCNIDKCVSEAREHLRANARTAAKSCLMKKKEIEKSLLEKETTLENINTLLERLQDIHTQKSVVDALQMGVDAFKQHKELDLDKVDNTMAAVVETLEMQNEIQNTLGTPVQDTADVSLLEEELYAILSDVNESFNEQLPQNKTQKRSSLVQKSLAEELSEDKNRLSFSHVPDLPSPPNQFEFDADDCRKRTVLLKQ